MILAALATLAVMACYAWQDWHDFRPLDCNDGRRYCSGKPQPSPFHRRFCGWNKHVLTVVTLASMLALGTLMGDWKRALLLISLPGAWLITTHPTCVDAPAMLLAWVAGLLFPHHPYFAVALSCASGVIHERGPVFAALYAWHPLLLVGLVGVGWWRKASQGADKDAFSGQRGLWGAVKAHKPYNDFLDWRVTFFSTRAVLPLAAYYGAPASAWATLAVAWGSRIVGTDFARFIFWAAPALIVALPGVPAWMVVVHLLAFRRQI